MLQKCNTNNNSILLTPTFLFGGMRNWFQFSNSFQKEKKKIMFYFWLTNFDSTKPSKISLYKMTNRINNFILILHISLT